MSGPTDIGAELGRDDSPRMRELMWKYRNLPMDLADAALVRVAERERLRRSDTQFLAALIRLASAAPAKPVTAYSSCKHICWHVTCLGS